MKGSLFTLYLTQHFVYSNSKSFSSRSISQAHEFAGEMWRWRETVGNQTSAVCFLTGCLFSVNSYRPHMVMNNAFLKK